MNIINELKRVADKDKVLTLQNFFKTKKGQYGYGDKFLGITVPKIRSISKKYHNLTQSELKTLLKDPYHEVRLAGVMVLVSKYETTKHASVRKKLFDFYVQNSRLINNWDLVDVSAYKIVGNFLYGKDKTVLYKLAKSENLWQRRISVVSTYYFIKNKEHKVTFKISKMLLRDKEDLMHKAVGWMLREVGKICGEDVLESFLKDNIKKMPRTTLRYAIERMSFEKRKFYLNM